uniref:Uncharacterized protein n=1 Tax=Sphaerodactylus townsendi TaxID=933632 RepID=A0ACB8ED34_9SAUR
MNRMMEAKDKPTPKCAPSKSRSTHRPSHPPPLTMCYVHSPTPLPRGFSACEQNGVARAKESSACLLWQDSARGCCRPTAMVKIRDEAASGLQFSFLYRKFDGCMVVAGSPKGGEWE